jgi:hypothetical protein
LIIFLNKISADSPSSFAPGNTPLTSLFYIFKNTLQEQKRNKQK